MPLIRCLFTLITASSIISIATNITDNTPRKVINVEQETCRTKNGALRNSSKNWIILWRIPIQNHSKSSVTEKRRNKFKYLTWNPITIWLVKNISILTPAKSLEYKRWYRPVKSTSNSIRYICGKTCSWSIRPKTILDIRKNTSFLLVINNAIIYIFFKDFSNYRKKTNRTVVFSWRSFPSILKNRDNWWNLLTISKTRKLQTPLTSSTSIYESSGSQFFTATTRIQSGPDTFDKSRFAVTFLTILRVTEILFSFRLVPQGETGKEIPESLRLVFRKAFSRQFCLVRYRRRHHQSGE